jgi:dienelactone hydrolase
VRDAEWALRQLTERFPGLPIGLVGHSMGGRTAMRVAGHPSVRAVVALAPWLPDGEPVEQLRGRSVLIAHGNTDVVTSPRASRRFAARAQSVAERVGFVTVCGDIHAMVLRWRTWHRLSTGFALGALGLAAMPRRLEKALARGADGIAV